MENIIFRCALGVSLTLHALALVQLSYNNTHYFKKPINRIEVVFQKKVNFQKFEKTPQVKKSITKTKIPQKPKVLLKDQNHMLSPIQDIAKPVHKFKLDKKLSSKVTPGEAQRKISVPAVKVEKISNPVYLNYYQVVRTQIQESAYQNYAQFDEGAVYLTFVLLSNGELKQIKLIDEKTSATAYLRSIGLKSIEEASPFPAFPQDLSYPELSFNVVISFEAK